MINRNYPTHKTKTHTNDVNEVKFSKGLCPALVAPVQPSNLIEYKNILNEFIKKSTEIVNIKIPPIFIICHPIPDVYIYLIVCVSSCLFLSLSLSFP